MLIEVPKNYFSPRPPPLNLQSLLLPSPPLTKILNETLVGSGGECAPSGAECEGEGEGNLLFKNEKNIQFRQRFIF